MDIRKGENKRESWWVTNNTNKTITIGDLLLLPALKPGTRVDLLHHYTREKISHSTILPQLVKSRKVSLNKDKLFNNEFPGPVPIADIDEAITPGEENEILKESEANDIYLRLDDTNYSKRVVRTDRITEDIILNAAHHEIFCNTDLNSVNVTLPEGTDGRHYRIINTGNSNNNVTLIPSGTNLLLGENSDLTLFDKDTLIITYETTEGWW